MLKSFIVRISAQRKKKHFKKLPIVLAVNTCLDQQVAWGVLKQVAWGMLNTKIMVMILV